MNLKNMLLSKRSQTQKDKCCVIPFCEISRIGKSTEREKGGVVTRDSGHWERGVTTSSVWDLQIKVIVAQQL